MPIKYALHPNPLTTNPNHHRAMIRHSSYSTDDLITVMIQRGSTVTKADALAVIEEYEAAIGQVIAGGGCVNTPLFRVSLSISGIFKNQNDIFDPDRHQFNVNFHPGLRIDEIAGDISFHRVDAQTPEPVLQSFTDVATHTINQQLTAGGAGIIKGYRLKINLQDKQQGLFCIASNGTEYRVDKILRNMPKELIFSIPDNLPSDTYALEIRVQIRKTTGIRTDRLNSELSVS